MKSYNLVEKETKMIYWSCRTSAIWTSQYSISVDSRRWERKMQT